jgi:hypothetical protein
MMKRAEQIQDSMRNQKEQKINGALKNFTNRRL